MKRSCRCSLTIAYLVRPYVEGNDRKTPRTNSNISHRHLYCSQLSNFDFGDSNVSVGMNQNASPDVHIRWDVRRTSSIHRTWSIAAHSMANWGTLIFGDEGNWFIALPNVIGSARQFQTYEALREFAQGMNLGPGEPSFICIPRSFITDYKG